MGSFNKDKKEKKETIDRNYFKYIAPLHDDVMIEIENTINRAKSIWVFRDDESGKEIAIKLNSIVDEILESKKLPPECEDLDDVAVLLGVMFGYAVCKGYGWEWMQLGDNEEDGFFSIVSPEKNFSNAPMPYLRRILVEQNIGLDGENDNTVLLLFNMMDNIDSKPNEKRYFPIA